MSRLPRPELIPGRAVAVRLPGRPGPVPAVVLDVYSGRSRGPERVSLAVVPEREGPRHVEVAASAVIATWADWTALRRHALAEHHANLAGRRTAPRTSPSCAAP